MLDVRRLLVLTHRYLGIAISLMFVVWFASGIAIIYAGDMPHLDQALRLERMPPLALSHVRLSPAQAVHRLESAEAAAEDSSASAGQQRARRAGGGRITLLTVTDRPAFRVQGATPGTIFADNGELLGRIGSDTARTVASRFAGLPEDRFKLIETIHEPDQWTLGGARDMPMHRFRIDDDRATELYVSAISAEVSLLTTRKQRVLAWVGTIPHWLYFAALRVNQPLWYKIVVGLSALGCVLAALGLILAFTQFRRVRPFQLSEAIPYRGLMRWHYISGAIFGVFALTWVFSGLLSMEPFDWTNAQGLEIRRDALSGGPPELASFDTMDSVALSAAVPGQAIKELGFVRIQGEDYYAVQATDNASGEQDRAEQLLEPYTVGRGEADRTLVHAGTLSVRREPFSTESIVTRLAAAAPEAEIVEQRLLQEYDSYYYSRGGQAPLPVLRVKFNDPAETWFYVDPRGSEILAQVHRLSRLERWLYNGLHSLDFSFWYGRRPLWDIGVIVLCLGGLATSSFGLYLGFKRLIRDLRPTSATEQTL
jgi:hypothetical protein